MRVRKRFGQHFLHDRGVRQRIVDAIDPQAGEHVVEIGPGPGALTEGLIKAAGRIDAIEIDRDLAAELRARFGAALDLHEGDALDFDFETLARQRGGPLRIVGNLPYNISTPLLFHLLKSVDHVVDLHVMLQKEVIDRMAAAPGDDAYGRLTVMLAPRLEITHLFDVGPGAFQPPPRVWSAVARLSVLPQPRFVVPPAFAAVVAAAFMQRRKTLRNSLRALIPLEAFEACGVDPGARPETLAPAAFAALAALAPTPAV
ncbi:MAG: 16S rRNA (adenine(1518)-N(6)/adenine(1519)-N(6))-dimethyltransferase RsmA [Steroidobacteraceae bacterium]